MKRPASATEYPVIIILPSTKLVIARDIEEIAIAPAPMHATASKINTRQSRTTDNILEIIALPFECSTHVSTVLGTPREIVSSFLSRLPTIAQRPR